MTRPFWHDPGCRCALCKDPRREAVEHKSDHREVVPIPGAAPVGDEPAGDTPDAA